MRAQSHTQPQSHRISHSPWRQQRQAGSPEIPAAQSRRRTRIRGLGDPQVSLWIRVWLLESLPESAEDFTARKKRERRWGRRRRERRRCSGPGGKEKSASSKLFLPSGCQLFIVWVLGAVLHMTRVWPGSARLWPASPRLSASFHAAVQQFPPLQSSFLSQRFLRGQKPRGLTWPALHVFVSMVMMTTGPPAVNTAPSVHALIDGRGSVWPAAQRSEICVYAIPLIIYWKSSELSFTISWHKQQMIKFLSAAASLSHRSRKQQIAALLLEEQVFSSSEFQ